jgi:hypothetical protein
MRKNGLWDPSAAFSNSSETVVNFGPVHRLAPIENGQGALPPKYPLD